MTDINTVNALIDQNESRIQDLFSEAEHALGKVNQTHDATTLTTTITSRIQTIQADLTALNTKLTEAEQSIETEVETVKDNLSNFRDRAAEVKSQVEAAIEQITNQLNELKVYNDDTLAEINQEVETTKSKLDELSQQVQDFEAEVDSQLENAKTSSQDFNEFVETVKDSFNERKLTLLDQFEEFEQAIKEKLESVVNNFTTLVEEGNNQLEALDGALDTASDQAIATLDKKLTEEVLKQFLGSTEKLTETMSSLSKVGEKSEEILDGKLGEIMNKISDVVDVIKDIKPLVDKVQSILG